MSQHWRTSRPGADEHAPFYAGYIACVPDGDLLRTLDQQLGESLAQWRGVPAGKAEFRYAEEKWSVKELINHVVDAERIFAYRVLRAARADATPVPGFDENDYARASRADGRTIKDLATEFEHLRRSNLALFASLDDEQASRRVTASNHPITANALMWVIAGHERHHAGTLREKYL